MMEEEARTKNYQKDDRQERLLRELNEQLAPVQAVLDAELTSPRMPVLFIVGAPRSGTTLLSQLLAYSASVGYVSNFVARFWLAPLVGAQIERALGIRSETPLEPFESEHGTTRGWASPHEFGYFWSHWFDRGQDTHQLSDAELAGIDAAALSRRIASLESAYGLPMSFKNNTWCTFQANWLARIFPSAIFLVCRRDPRYIAQSLLSARRKRLGSESAWWSVRPPSYRKILELPRWEQVAAQAVEVVRAMDEALSTVSAPRRIEVPYEKLCSEPRVVLNEIVMGLKAAGTQVQPLRPVPERFESTDIPRLAVQDWKRVVEAVQRFQREGVCR